MKLRDQALEALSSLEDHADLYDNTCIRCRGSYYIGEDRDGASMYCDPCAQDVVIELARGIVELTTCGCCAKGLPCGEDMHGGRCCTCCLGTGVEE